MRQKALFIVDLLVSVGFTKAIPAIVQYDNLSPFLAAQ